MPRLLLTMSLCKISRKISMYMTSQCFPKVVFVVYQEVITVLFAKLCTSKLISHFSGQFKPPKRS